MMRKKLAAYTASESSKSMEQPLWRASAVAFAAAALLGLASTNAYSLALGRVTVQSALGEPLRADIEIPEINSDEAASLRATVAPPEAFRAAGLEYNPAISNLSITLLRRPDGRMYLRLTSERPINDPFVDLILEANWASGRILRDYTMLFDPPNLRQSSPSVVAPMVPSAAGTTPVPPPSTATARPVAPVSAAPGPGTRVRPPALPMPAPIAKAPMPSGESGKQVTVKPGDTASKIASANKPTTLSLDQMLVSLLRTNPDAFIGGNINRIRSGAVVNIPSAEQAGQISETEASQTVIAQSRDFNDFRRRLAQGVPTTRVAAADRQASGTVKATVEDKKPAAATPDKLTLSKGAVQAKAAEEKIARERQAKESSARVAELSKNISDLSKLGTSTMAAPAAAATSAPGKGLPVGAVGAASMPTKPASLPSALPMTVTSSASVGVSKTATLATSTVTSLPAAVVSTAPVSKTAAVAATPSAAPALAAASAAAAKAITASAPVMSAVATMTPTVAAVITPTVASAATPTAQAPSVSAPATPTVAAAPKAAPKPPPPPPEPSLVDEVLDNPLAIAGGLGALGVLGGGFFLYRAQKRRKSGQVDSSFLESRLQPDSFFGASGGQRIDTNESASATGSSMVYSPSQLDAAGDVDPVAEADVYLAYGRDLQAEEILKEALRTTPARVAIHAKLLEIYAKRRDSKGFEFIATEAFSLTGGEGADWERICEMGRELDPANPLYSPGGQPQVAAGPRVADPTAGYVPTTPFGAAVATETQALAPQSSPSSAPDLDLDLDFSLGDAPAPPSSAGMMSTTPLKVEPTVAMRAVPEPVPASLDMNFGALKDAKPAVQLAAPDEMMANADLSFSNDAFELPPLPTSAAPSPVATKVEPVSSGMIEFDLGSLSLDLDAGQPASVGKPAQAPSAVEFHDSGEDNLATKLALAEEFFTIGDTDGARSIAQEVLAEASGALKVKAQRFLAELS